MPSDLSELEDALQRLFQTLKRPQRWETLAAEAGVALDRPAGAILHLLMMHSGKRLRLSDIASALAIEAPSATRKTQELEHAGYINRQTDPEDKRSAHFGLTPLGASAGKQLKAAQQRMLKRALADWPADQRAQLAQLMSRFSDSISATYNPEGDSHGRTNPIK